MQALVTATEAAQSTREELLTNVVSALSNISFYCGGGSGAAGVPMVQRGQKVSGTLIRMLLLGVSKDNESKTAAPLPPPQ